MIYICAQPAIFYYGWQIETMLHNFIKQGVDIKNIHILLCSVNNKIDNCFYRLKAKYPNANFFFYADTRGKFEYISTVRPHILKKHFETFPELSSKTIFYHDSDIVFTRPVDFSHLNNDNINYLSDTVSYIGYDYILSKGRDVLDKMLEIVDIPEDLVKNNQKNSGGAQYILKNITSEFWEKVEKDCERLFVEITKINTLSTQKIPLQIWCADMWAVLWNLWKDGKETRLHDDLNFVFAIDTIAAWDKVNIYHNAGVTGETNDYFHKQSYMNELPPENLKISDKYVSYNYYNLVKEAVYGRID